MISLDVLLKDIQELCISRRAYNCLHAGNFQCIGDLACNPNLGENFKLLNRIPNIGKKSILEIINALKELGFKNIVYSPDFLLERVIKYGDMDFYHYEWNFLEKVKIQREKVLAARIIIDKLEAHLKIHRDLKTSYANIKYAYITLSSFFNQIEDGALLCFQDESIIEDQK